MQHINMSDAMREMPRYKCHKEVWALKIAQISPNEDGTSTLNFVEPGYAAIDVDSGFCKGKGGDLGYYVVYLDGYRSWSPTKAFEEGYSRV